MAAIFVVFLTLFALHYFLFPLLVLVASAFIKRPVNKEPITPSVTLIVAAYNEEKIIEAKLKNIATLDYPYGKLEVIVVADGSNDRTPEIVEGFTLRPIKNLYHPLRRGKTHALDRAVGMATGEILLFSDANTFYRPDAIRKLVRNFADSSVGGVTGQKRIFKEQSRASSVGDRLYWSFESRLKEKESSLGSIPTGDGEIFAIRAKLYRHLPAEIINDDMAITLNIIGAGKRVVYEPEAISEEVASLTLQDDFRVKARMVAGGFQILSEYRKLLTRPTFFSLQLWVHKGLRYLMPLILMGIFLSSLALTPSYPVVALFLIAQLGAYFMASLGAIRQNAGKDAGVCYVPYYYCLMNMAALQGLIFFIQKKSGVAIWKKAVR